MVVYMCTMVLSDNIILAFPWLFFTVLFSSVLQHQSLDENLSNATTEQMFL